jgi:hypothetical protein
MRKQMFIDGNKRTAMLAGNHTMISNGAGIITVPLEDQTQFRDMLIKFYETNDMTQIKDFVYEKCIDGVDFPKEPPTPAFDGTEPWKLPEDDNTAAVPTTETSTGPKLPGE